MRYRHPQLLQRLAGEYVLGTLHGRARRRFERLMVESHAARSAVWRWEQELGPLAQASGSVQPSIRVWREILRRTGAQTTQAPWYERLGLWRGLTLAAAAAALVLAVMLRTAPVAGPQYVAVFSGEQSQPLWVVSVDVDRERLSIRPINATPPATDKSYELWVLPAGGAAPRSMGLLPTGAASVETDLPAALQSLLSSAQGLAISLEPAGGSPTGAPTGPVLHQAAILAI
ncbi:MAG: anti-sigma factor [Steroidobacter sp.]